MIETTKIKGINQRIRMSMRRLKNTSIKIWGLTQDDNNLNIPLKI